MFNDIFNKHYAVTKIGSFQDENQLVSLIIRQNNFIIL
jgi:hypothetical protein